MFTSSASLCSSLSESLVTLGFLFTSLCSAYSAMLLRLTLIICSGSSTCTSVLSVLLLVALCIQQQYIYPCGVNSVIRLRANLLLIVLLLC